MPTLSRVHSLRALLDRCGLAAAPTPTTEALARLDDLLGLRARWNRTHKLMGPQVAAEPWGIDVVDCVALSLALEPTLPLVDVGAGAGTPGLLLAALSPERAVHLVEPLAKRVAFLRVAASQLALPHLTVTRGRWPLSLSEPSQVVSRAVVSPTEWPTLALSAGPSVRVVLCMLAGEAPPRPALSGLRREALLTYRTAAGAPRRIERWLRPPASS